MKQIMKKAVLTFGLFSLVVLTSFASGDTGGNGTSTSTTTTYGTGGQGTSVGGGSSTTKKLDYAPVVNSVSNSNAGYSSNVSLSVSSTKSDM